MKHPKVLVVTFDSLYMFAKHTDGIVKKVGARNRILKALTGSTGDKDKETILATYNAISRHHQYWITLPQYGLLQSATHNKLNYSHHRTLPSEQLQDVM